MMKEMTGQDVIFILHDNHRSEALFQDVLITNSILAENYFDPLTSKIRFKNCRFRGELSFYFKASTEVVLIFDESEFFDKCLIQGNLSELVISNCHFHSTASFSDVMKTGIFACDSVFSSLLFIRGSIERIIFQRNLHAKESQGVFNMSGQVNGEASFESSTLRSVQFMDLTFSKNVVFSRVNFKSDNDDSHVFHNVIFKSEFEFNRVAVQGHFFMRRISVFGKMSALWTTGPTAMISIANSVFHDRVQFDYSNFLELEIEGSEFQKLASFKNLKLNRFIFERCVNAEKLEFLGAKIENGSRETFRIIRREFYNIGEHVEEQHYRAKELSAYQKELFLKKRYDDFVLLVLNWLSNKHGISWGRGVAFTLFSGLLFYAFYLISLNQLPFHFGWAGWSSFLEAVSITTKYFVTFFIVTHDLEFMKSFGPSGLSYIIDFIGKIFIGYGIYQTVVAFRKHGKG